MVEGCYLAGLLQYVYLDPDKNFRAPAQNWFFLIGMNIVIHSRIKYFLVQNSHNYPWHWIIFPIWPRSAKLDNHKRHSVMFLKVSHATESPWVLSKLRIGLSGRKSRITAANEVYVPLQCDVIRVKKTFIRELRISCLISIAIPH